MPPVPAANASWSRRILRGPTIRPLALTGLGAGACNGFAPEEWRIAAHAPDNSLFHVMAEKSFQHAIYKEGALNGAVTGRFREEFSANDLRRGNGVDAAAIAPLRLCRARLRQSTRAGRASCCTASPATVLRFGWPRSQAAKLGWAKPLVGAVVLSMRCASPGAPALLPRDPALLATRISTRCIQGACSEGDFAATYLTVLRLGYVHNDKNRMFLVHPHGDFWQDGPEGPGFYHQIGGENEKLEPGRIN